jgi:E1-E2 ATPase
VTRFCSARICAHVHPAKCYATASGARSHAHAQVLQTEFEFRRIRFELDRPANTFRPVQYPDSNTVGSYLEARGYESDAAALAALEKWGTNTVDVPVPRFMEMLKEQMMAPFFVFQVRYPRGKCTMRSSTCMCARTDEYALCAGGTSTCTCCALQRPAEAGPARHTARWRCRSSASASGAWTHSGTTASSRFSCSLSSSAPSSHSACARSTTSARSRRPSRTSRRALRYPASLDVPVHMSVLSVVACLRIWCSRIRGACVYPSGRELCMQVLRAGEWKKMPGEMLLPGDVFFLTLPSRASGAATGDDDDALVPVDALLLGGGAIADESVLTGESTPQWKEPVAGGDAASAERLRQLDVTRDKLHVLFGGTKVRNVTAGELPGGRGAAPAGGAPCVVLRTGFETAQGRLMRTILLSTERLTANTVETGLFICFLLLFAIAAAGARRHATSLCCMSRQVPCTFHSVACHV